MVLKMNLEVLPEGKHSAKQNRRVDRRNFRVPRSFAGVDVGEVVEESSMRGHLLSKEAECDKNSFARIGKGNKSAFLSDAKSSQPKPRCCNAANNIGVVRPHVA